MPKIPDYSSRASFPETAGTVQVPVGPAVLPAETAAEGFGQLSDIGFDLDRRLGDLKRLQESTSLKVQSTQELYDLQSGLGTSQDFFSNPEGTLDTFRKSAEVIRQKYHGLASDDFVRADFDQHFQGLILSRNIEFQNAARKQRIESAKGSLDSNLFKLKNLALQAENNHDIKRITQLGLETIDEHAVLGVVGLDDAPKMRRKFVSDIGESFVDRDIRLNPQVALDNILAGKYDSILQDEAKKEKVIAKAQRQADILSRHTDAELARQESRSERFAKQIRDQTEMDLWARDDLSIEMIEQAERTRSIDAGGARALRKKVYSEEGKDNKDIVFAYEAEIFSPGLDEEKAGELRVGILNSVSKGHLSSKTGGDLLKSLLQNSRADDISKSPVYKQASDYIDDQLRTTGPGAEILDPDEQARRAGAKREFDSRVRGREEPWEVADDVVKRYRRNPLTTSSLPNPLFLHPGDNSNDIAALDRAEEATVHQFVSGYIDVRTFERETENIKKLKEIIQQEMQTGSRRSGSSAGHPQSSSTSKFNSRGNQ
jgi:hypothetical protein